MPTLQEQAAKMMLRSVDMLFTAARHVPEDKRDWSPNSPARSTQSQLAECAVVPQMFAAILQAGAFTDAVKAAMGKMREETAAITTLEAAEELARPRYASLAEVIRALPEEKLDQTMMTPFRGGMEMTVADLIFMPYWNLTYHIGQINYIQTLLGDVEMH